MGKTTRKKKDGTGPREGSFMDRKHGKGRRQLAGLPCPKKKK